MKGNLGDGLELRDGGGGGEADGEERLVALDVVVDVERGPTAGEGPALHLVRLELHQACRESLCHFGFSKEDEKGPDF